MITIENLRYAYPESREFALQMDELKVPEGEVLLLTGPSGSGKTSLLRAIAGSLHSFRGGRLGGRVDIAGLDPRTVPMSRIARYAVYVGQEPEDQLVAGTVLGQLLAGPENLGWEPRRSLLAVEEMMDALGLGELRQRRLDELSGGQRQKVVLASALTMQPGCLLLDEPTSQLDPVAAEELMATLRRLNEDLGMTVLLAEHRTERCAHYAERMLYMEEGRAVFLGHPADALGSPAEPFLPPAARLWPRGLLTGKAPLTVRQARHQLKVSIPPGPLSAAGLAEPAPAGPVLVRISRLAYAYPTGNRVLKGIDLDICAGQVTVIMGPNGAGKTTLLKHLNGLLRADSGRIEVAGLDASAGVAAMAPVCGLLGQDPGDYLLGGSVRREVARTPEWRGVPEPEAGRRVERALADVGLAGTGELPGESLSSGMRQRLALATVLAGDPAVLALDEPTRGLEPPAKVGLAELLRRLAVSGKAVILVTHDVEFAAAAADRVVIIGDGAVIADGPPRLVMSGNAFLSPQTERIMRGRADGVLTPPEAKRLITAARAGEATQ